MKKLLTFISLFISSLGFVYPNEDISSQIEAINKATKVVVVPEISIPVIELNVIDINNIKTDNIVFTYYLTGAITLSDILHATYFTSLGIDVNVNTFNNLKDILNPSQEWTDFYDNKVKPMYDYYKAKQDLLGIDGIYYPDAMTYYGWKWLNLEDKQKQEGFTNEIRLEWIQLFKEMKPHYLKYENR